MPTTSGVYDLTETRDSIITDSLQLIAVMDPNDTLDNNSSAFATRLLNRLIKRMQGQADFAAGLKMWTKRTGCIFLQSFQKSYALGPSSSDKWTNGYVATTLAVGASAAASSVTVSTGSYQFVTFGEQSTINIGDKIGFVYNQMNIYWTTVTSYNSSTGVVGIAGGGLPAVGAGTVVFNYTTQAQRMIPPVRSFYLRDNTNNDIPMDSLTMEEYDASPSKNDPNNTGDPTSCYFQDESGRNNLTRMFLGDVSGPADASKRIHVSYWEPIQIFTQGTDLAEFPEEYYNYIIWALAKQLAPGYPAVVWDQVKEQNYQEAMAIAQQKNPERLTKFFQSGIY